jgi:centriolar protein POC1
VRSVEFLSDGKTLLTASDDKSVKMWDIDTLKFKGSFLGHNNWINCARANAEMTMVCSGGEDKKLLIWDVEKRK